MSDTVGFIRNLPTTLVKAFRATLEEVNEAALILHVVDVSAPAAADHTAHVFKVLAEIGAAQIPQILVLNKIDRAAPGASLAEAGIRSVAISALTGEGIDRLLAAIDEVLPLDPIVRETFRLRAGDGARLAMLHQFGRVIETRYTGEDCVVEAEVPESLKRRMQM
jgi:GTP-binding protein HflX